jgi:hypothetical protein
VSRESWPVVILIRFIYLQAAELGAELLRLVLEPGGHDGVHCDPLHLPRRLLHLPAPVPPPAA